ncbi:TPA: transposase [Corynebacterium striatum]|nr:transposase [Corynebacterium striatum]
MTPFTDAKWCPPKLDANRYKDRNVVERFFPRAKKCRGLATRIDKHAINYRGGTVHMAQVPSTTLTSPGRQDSALQEHRAMVKAISKRDAVTARDITR